MFHRSISASAIAGLSVVLFGAAPAGAGVPSVDAFTGAVDLTDPTGTPIVSLRMAERGYDVRTTSRPADPTGTPIVSLRMAERGYEVRTTSPPADPTGTPIVSLRMAERG